jgi:hypothetical protein
VSTENPAPIEELKKSIAKLEAKMPFPHDLCENSLVLTLLKCKLLALENGRESWLYKPKWVCINEQNNANA